MDMKEMIEKFPKLVKEGWALGDVVKRKKNVTKVIFLGMGGSAISGEIISEVAKLESKVPIEVVKGYDIPNYVNRRTLVVAISYSGNTEETLSALDQAIDKNAIIVGISSGGKLKEIAEEKGFDFVEVPKGYAPRAALPLLLFSALRLLVKSRVLRPVKIENIIEAINLVDKNKAKKWAEIIKDKTPVVYGSGPFRAVAKRWANQFNENSKILAFWGEFPEMNHNEIVGWWGDEKNKNFVPIILRGGIEHPRVLLRHEITLDIGFKRAGESMIYEAEGTDLWARILNTIYFGDWISYNLALLRGVNPLPVKVIDELKSRLSSKK